jgi:hypothetical protein
LGVRDAALFDAIFSGDPALGAAPKLSNVAATTGVAQRWPD